MSGPDLSEAEQATSTFNTDEPVPFETALEMTGNGLYNVLLSSTCGWILLAIGVDLFGFSLVVTAACDLNLTIMQKGILTSLPFIGILLVSYLWGYIADTRGRRFTLLVSMQVSFVLSCLCSLAPNWIFLGVCKFFTVCFSCAANSATYTLVGESCVQKFRSKYMLLMTCLLLISPAIAGVLAYPTLKLNFVVNLFGLGIEFRPWRLLAIVLALPSGVGAIAIYYFQESPKFLANIGKVDEALDVLRRIHVCNHGTSDKFKVHSVTVEEKSLPRASSLVKALVEQSAPLFQPPLLWRTLQLYYVVAIVYITNNSYLMWLPHMFNLLKIALEADDKAWGNVCSLMSTGVSAHHHQPAAQVNYTPTLNITQDSNVASLEASNICLGRIEDNVVFTLIASQTLFAFLNFIISYLQNHRKLVLLCVLCISAAGGIATNLIPEPITSVLFFVLFTCTNLGMGILASYFVDLYPTSCRGMVACLSIMVGRTSTFIGINVVGNLIFRHCELTIYLWSLLVLSSAVAAFFLPPDKKQQQ